MSTPLSQRARGRTSAVVSTVVRILLGGVWLYAGIAKLRDLDTSVLAVREYRLLPDGLEPLVGHALPVVEIAIGLLLVTGLFTRGAAIASSVVLVGFIIGLASAQARGLEIQCGCFGGTDAPGGISKVSEIARDVVFLLGSLWLVWRPRSLFSADSLRVGVHHDTDDVDHEDDEAEIGDADDTASANAGADSGDEAADAGANRDDAPTRP